MSEITVPKEAQAALKAAFLAKTKSEKEAQYLFESKLTEWQIVINNWGEVALFPAYRVLGYDPVTKQMMEKGE